MPAGLDERYIRILYPVFARFPEISEVMIFGSRAKGAARRTSDIDLAVKAPRMSDSDWADLREAMEEAPIAFKMDIVRLDKLTDARLKAKIELEGQSIYVRAR